MHLAPTTLKAAKEFVAAHHRHNSPPTGWKWGVSLVDDAGSQLGVAIAGRPIARMLDDGTTLEVTRVCTLGDRNANSMLYGAILRAAKALGYRRVLTYTLPDESGASLKAVGFKCDGEAGGGEWSRPSRPREPSDDVGYEPTRKLRWSITW